MAPKDRTVASGDRLPSSVSLNHVYDEGQDKWVPQTQGSGSGGDTEGLATEDTLVQVRGYASDQADQLIDANVRLEAIKNGITGPTPAGENHIGSVGGDSANTSATANVQAAAYAANQAYGGLLTFNNAMRVAGGSGLLQSVRLVDSGNNKPSGYLILFNANPDNAGTTLTDRANSVIHANDIPKVIRVIPVNSADWVSLPTTSGSFSICDPDSISKVVKLSAGTTVYGVFLLTSAITPGAVATLTATLGLLRD